MKGRKIGRYNSSRPDRKDIPLQRPLARSNLLIRISQYLHLFRNLPNHAAYSSNKKH